MNHASSNESNVVYKDCTIRLMSYRSGGQWVPHALVIRSAETEEKGHPVTGEWDYPLPTKEAADEVAELLAMGLIDSQCEHDYQLESVGGVYLPGAYVCRLCSHRIAMSEAQLHRHAHYPRHYQATEKTGDPSPIPPGMNLAVQGPE